MSVNYTGILVRKAVDKPIEVICDDIDCDFIKNCMSGWTIDGEECCPSEDFDKEIKNHTKFIHTKYLFTVKKSDFAVDAFNDFEQEHSKNDSDKIIFHYENGNDMNLLKKIVDDKMKIEISNDTMKKIIEMNDEEKKAYHNQFLNIYLSYPIYHKGAFYSAGSFNDIEKRADKQLEEIFENKIRWNNLKNSLDYLKLSREEKEYIEESFEGKIEDFDNEILYMKESAMKVRHLCEAFSTWKEEEVYLYIYADSSEYDELPEWIYEFKKRI